ncbi:hypothetical protein Y032_0388g493 [Ancylostoma ceylanicum]|uniref:Uncharacterized protein n=1 Tax=Ancylostoma ceylanicum TaxID=53326 RepID=A0A016RT07_9BILA|nr:hypothetical protein Y032_0388g493 [Ancylostoma ceylanicum]
MLYITDPKNHGSERIPRQADETDEDYDVFIPFEEPLSKVFSATLEGSRVLKSKSKDLKFRRESAGEMATRTATGQHPKVKRGYLAASETHNGVCWNKNFSPSLPILGSE